MKRFKTVINELKIEVPDKEETAQIDRKEMPQIDSKHLADFISFMENKGIKTTKKSIDPKDLKATQGQFHKAKIEKIMDAVVAGEMDEKPIVVSNDGYVMDGHHRWLAYLNLGKNISVYQVNLTVDKLLSTMNEYPKSFTKKLYEAFAHVCELDETAKVITKDHLVAFEKIIDKLFKHFNIDFEFTKHFHDRLSHVRNDPAIDIKELGEIIKKIYSKKKGGDRTLSKHLDTEVVLKDLQSNINIPVAIEYDRKEDDIDVIFKTVMRKKNFKTPNKVIKL